MVRAVDALVDLRAEACDNFQHLYRDHLGTLEQLNTERAPVDQVGAKLHEAHSLVAYLLAQQVPDVPCGVLNPNEAALSLFLQTLSAFTCSEPDQEPWEACIRRATPMVDSTGEITRSPQAYEALYLSLGKEYVERFPTGNAVQSVMAKLSLVSRNIELRSATSTGISGSVIDRYNYEMVPIQPGWFAMGSPEDEKDRDDDEDLHLVRITVPFLMGSTEVTQELYQAVMKTNPSQLKGLKRPVDSVTWLEAIFFCNRLSELEGLQPVYGFYERDEETRKAIEVPYTYEMWKEEGHGDVGHWSAKHPNFQTFPEANGYRLPREAEWEYAARAGRPNPSPTDDGWDLDNTKGRHQVVGKKPPNPWGLFDMAGNVWEWVRDEGSTGAGWISCTTDYKKDWIYCSPLAVPKIDDFDGFDGAYQFSLQSSYDQEAAIRRGGGHDAGSQWIRSANRGSAPKNERLNQNGFRVARSLGTEQFKVHFEKTTTADLSQGPTVAPLQIEPATYGYSEYGLRECFQRMLAANPEAEGRYLSGSDTAQTASQKTGVAIERWDFHPAISASRPASLDGVPVFSLPNCLNTIIFGKNCSAGTACGEAQGTYDVVFSREVRLFGEVNEQGVEAEAP